MFRVDHGRLDGITRTPQGGLRVSAYVTRTGVFTYRTTDGKVVRELRHPDEVFHADSLASLEDAPVTNRHPKAGQVTPEVYTQLAVGHSKQPKRDGVYVSSQLVIQDAGTIAEVSKGALKEVSCGYTCDMDERAGVYNGETYDCVQVNIRYNHVALGPPGWGRAGASVALRLDSDDAIQSEQKESTMPKLVTLDGKPFEYGTAEHVDALTVYAAKLEASVATATQALGAAKAEAETASGRADAAEAALKAAVDPARFDAAVSARQALHASARKVLGADHKFDGMSDKDVMLTVCVKKNPSFRTDASDDYIRGAFEHVTTIVDTVGEVRAAVVATAVVAPVTTIEQRRADAAASARDAWKQPLSVTRK